MTRYPIPLKDVTEAKPDPQVQKRKEARKKVLEIVWKKRAEVLRRMYKR
jgi:hypothetical protein